MQDVAAGSAPVRKLFSEEQRALLRRARARGTFQVAAESRAFLAERHIEVGGAQTTKTRKALEFFSEQLTPTG